MVRHNSCLEIARRYSAVGGTGAGCFMSDEHDDKGKVPLMQRLLDNPFLLLFLGVLIPMLLYTLWGVIDILTIPAAK